MRNRLIRVLIGALALTTLTGALHDQAGAASAGDRPVVRTAGGVLRGVAAADHDGFLGIPYAAPPIGDLRWRAPRPAAAWRGVRDATTAGPPCAQKGRRGGPAVVGSEDCLYLNVTTPVPPADGHRRSRLPVMVWFHGGGFTSGSGADYDPTRLVSGGHVIVVTVNYRLGPFGFLDLPPLARQDPYAGNYALADQQAALRWVHRNATAFGGDPGNVTIFGQSAGGYAVCTHLAAPGSRGLFQKAIVQSGPCGNPLVTAATAQRRGATVATGLGCPPTTDVLACLRAKPAGDLVGAGVQQPFTAAGMSTTAWEFVAGTPAVPEQPLKALRDGHAARVPLIQGGTHDEMRQTVASLFDQRGTPLQPADYPAVLHRFFGAVPGDPTAAVLAHYPVADYPSAGIALATVLTDWGHAVGACQVLPADDAAARRAPVYAYEFDQDGGRHVGDFPLGATHGSDLPYLFDGTYDWTPPPAPDAALSAEIIGYWTRFARTGDPNAAGAPYWPRYRAAGPVLSLAAARTTPVDFATEHQCGFWRKVGNIAHRMH